MSEDILELSDNQIQNIINVILEGKPIAEVVDFPQESLESAYSFAYQHYTTKNYKEAKKIFKLLTLYDHFDSRFSMGLAGCYQGLGEYEKAIDLYQAAAIAEGLADPTPLYYASLCYINLGKVEEAIVGLEGAVSVGELSKYTEIREAARKLRDLLNEAKKT